MSPEDRRITPGSVPAAELPAPTNPGPLIAETRPVGFVVLTPDRHTGAWDINWDVELHATREKAEESAKLASESGWRAQVAEIRKVGDEIPPDESVRGYLWDHEGAP